VAAAPDKGPGFFQTLANTPRFFREVRAEARKIHWTSRQETWITSVMVGIMVILAAIFFAIVNQVLSLAITAIVKFATGG
jgi:preprotein translocase subunit SecE